MRAPGDTKVRVLPLQLLQEPSFNDHFHPSSGIHFDQAHPSAEGYESDHRINSCLAIVVVPPSVGQVIKFLDGHILP